MSWIHEVDALTILLGPQKMSTVNILFPCTLLEVLCFWKEFGLNETWNNWWCYTKWCTFLGPRQHPWVFKPQKTSKLRWMDVVWNSLHQKHPAGTYYFWHHRFRFGNPFSIPVSVSFLKGTFWKRAVNCHDRGFDSLPTSTYSTYLICLLGSFTLQLGSFWELTCIVSYTHRKKNIATSWFFKPSRQELLSNYSMLLPRMLPFNNFIIVY